MTAPARSGRALVIALSLLSPPAATLGCLPPVKESRLEQGQTITTGKEPYDTFFQAVRAAREEALKVESEAASTRLNATRRLGLKDEVTPDDALAAARAQAAKLREAGVLLHLELTPETKLVSASNKAKIGADDQSLIDTLEDLAKSLIAASRQFDDLASRTAELEKKRAALEVDARSTFAGEPTARREEIQGEIDAAHRILADVTEFCADRSGLASKFALDLAQAIETGAGARARANSPGAAPGAPAAGEVQRAAAAKPSATAPAAGGRRGPPNGGPPATAPTPSPPTPSPPTPKPSGDDDFEP